MLADNEHHKHNQWQVPLGFLCKADKFNFEAGVTGAPPIFPVGILTSVDRFMILFYLFFCRFSDGLYAWNNKAELHESNKKKKEK